MCKIARTLATAESLSVFERAIPPELVADVLAEAGIRAKRLRKLPPEVVVWLLVSMNVFRSLRIENVLKLVNRAFGRSRGWGVADSPCSTSISEARDRVGSTVMPKLFRAVTARLVERHAEVASWRGHAVVVLDGSCFSVADTARNETAFGRPPSYRGGAKSGFPGMRGVFVFQSRTHLIEAAAFGPYRTGEQTLAYEVLPQIRAGTVVVMDRAFFGYQWLCSLAKASVHFVVRAKSGRSALQVTELRRIGDRDHRGRIEFPRELKRRNRSLNLPASVEVRLIEFDVITRNGPRTIRVVTSLLDPAKYPAHEIAGIFGERWEAELAYRELKTHQVATQVTFRSHTPERVMQEAWGLATAYNCVRALMAEGAELKRIEPRRLSFVDSLERIRAALITASTATQTPSPIDLTLELSLCVLPPKRAGRTCPRAVKIKMSKYPRKRPASERPVRAGDRL